MEPTPPPPPPSISDLYGGLDEAQRNAFLEQYGLAPTPPPPAPIERPDVDERDMFDSGSVPGEPRMGTMGGSGFGRFPLGTAGPEYLYDEAGNPIMGPQDFGFGPGIRPTEIIGPDGSFVGSGSVTPPQDMATAVDDLGVPIFGGRDRAKAIPQPDPAFDIPGVDLEKIRESLAKMEPIIPGISLPEPAPGRGGFLPGPGTKGPGAPGPQANQDLLDQFNNAQAAQDFGLTATFDPTTGQYVTDLGAMGFQGDQRFKTQSPEEFAAQLAPKPIPAPTPRPAFDEMPLIPIPQIDPGRIRVADPIKVRPPGKIAPLPIKRSPPPVKGPTLPIKRSPLPTTTPTVVPTTIRPPGAPPRS